MRAQRFRQVVLPALIVSGLIGVWASGTLLAGHDGGWVVGDSEAGAWFTWCAPAGLPSVNCAEVVQSRWGSFDVYLLGRRWLVPVSFLGLAYFLGVTVWLALVRLPETRADRIWRLFAVGLVGGGAVSVFLTVNMLRTVGSWCPLCLLAHMANGVIVLGMAGAWWTSPQRPTSSTGLVPPPIVAQFRRRLRMAGALAIAVAIAGSWQLYESITKARYEWRRRAGLESVLAQIQSDPDRLLREFYAQPLVDGSEVPSQDGSEQAAIIIFTESECPSCLCLARAWSETLMPAFQHRARVDVRRLSENRSLAEQWGVREAPAVFLNGRRVPPLCLNSETFWRAMGEKLHRNKSLASAQMPPAGGGGGRKHE